MPGGLGCVQDGEQRLIHLRAHPNGARPLRRRCHRHHPLRRRRNPRTASPNAIRAPGSCTCATARSSAPTRFLTASRSTTSGSTSHPGHDAHPMPGRHAGAPTAPTVWPATLKRKINPITFDSTGRSQRRCAVASARCCRAGERASHDETVVARLSRTRRPVLPIGTSSPAAPKK
jgi:hypothetical protein